MKVVVDKKEVFQPIVITLEDKDEAAAFWHMCNRAFTDEYCRNYGAKGNYLRQFKTMMFQAMDPLIGAYACSLGGKDV
jgi:hypothetical protein